MGSSVRRPCVCDVPPVWLLCKDRRYTQIRERSVRMRVTEVIQDGAVRALVARAFVQQVTQRALHGLEGLDALGQFV